MFWTFGINGSMAPFVSQDSLKSEKVLFYSLQGKTSVFSSIKMV